MNNSLIKLSIFALVVFSMSLVVQLSAGASARAGLAPGAATAATAGFRVAVDGGDKGDDRDDDDSDFEFRGVIETLPNTAGFIGDWVVSGRTVHVSAKTEIEKEDGQVAVGASVKVEGALQTDNSVMAREIEVKDGAGAESSFTGMVEMLPDTMGRIGDWKVSGKVVHVSAMTLIKQEKAMVAVGVQVEVKGTQRADGSIDAFKIEVKSDINNGGTVDFTGTIESLPGMQSRIGEWSVGGRKVNVTAATRIKPDNAMVAVGFRVEVKGTLRQDGSVDATEIEVKSKGGGGGNFVEFDGVVEALPGTANQIGIWTISGRMVNVAADTKIDTKGVTIMSVAVGAKVEVKGALQADSSINATKIKLRNRVGQFEFKGVINGLPLSPDLVGDWMVSGRTVHVTAATEIERKFGMVAIGAFVEVEGALQSDGSVNAAEIEVKQGPAGGAFMNFNQVTMVGAAGYQDDNAPESIVSAFGANMSSVTATASTQPLPLSLGDVSVIIDGKQARLFFVSPNQINCQIPTGAAAGSANVVVMNKGQMVSQGSVQISGVAPSLFTANASGTGVPAGLVLRVKANGQQTFEPLARFDAGSKQFTAAPIARRAGDQLFLILFGSGLKQAQNSDGNSANGVAENVQVTIGGLAAQVIFAGSAPGFAGLEQINVRIPDNSPASPNTSVTVKVRDRLNNLKPANPVTISLQ
jgi:uncharacterized protein (TIGR03437 family)